MAGETATGRAMPDVRLEENMSPVQIDVEGVQAASYEAPSEIYTFLSAYLPPEDISFLRQTDELSLLSVSDAFSTGIEAQISSDGGPGSAAAVVSASVAAIASLERVTYCGSGGDAAAGCGTGCVVCIQDYEVEDELSVMPCSGRHMFHRKCIADWLACSHLCPLCRHALPAEKRTTS